MYTADTQPTAQATSMSTVRNLRRIAARSGDARGTSCSSAATHVRRARVRKGSVAGARGRGCSTHDEAGNVTASE
jgi:hypothetical protein